MGPEDRKRGRRVVRRKSPKSVVLQTETIEDEELR